MVFRRSEETRQLCFPCALFELWLSITAKFRLHLLYNLDLFTRGFEYFRSPFYLKMSLWKASGDILLAVFKFSPQRSSGPHQPARCHDKARCPEVICVKRKRVICLPWLSRTSIQAQQRKASEQEAPISLSDLPELISNRQGTEAHRRVSPAPIKALGEVKQLCGSSAAESPPKTLSICFPRPFLSLLSFTE